MKTPIEKGYGGNICELLNKVVDIPGDIIELGVYNGRNSLIMGNFLCSSGPHNKKYVGFDTFYGYTAEDIQEAINAGDSADGIKQNQESGRWVICMESVIGRLKKASLTNYCKLVGGDIKQTVPAYLRDKSDDYLISMIYIDCNVYLAAITALRACKNYLSDGAMIVVDEHTIGGETRALNDFAKECDINIHHTTWKHPHGPRLYGIYKK